jgi:uncharacterized GH25 family protein
LYGVLLYEIFDKEDWHDAQRNFSQRIRAPLRFGGTGKSDAEGKFRIDSVIADQDCYVVYRVSKEAYNFGGDDTFQLAKFRLERPGAEAPLGDCRINPVSLDGWQPTGAETLPKFTVRFLNDKTGKPIANQRVEIGWSHWSEEYKAKLKELQKKADDVSAKFGEIAKKAEDGEISEDEAKEIAKDILPDMVVLLDPADFREPRPFIGDEINTDADGKIEFSFPKAATVYDPKDVCLTIGCFRSMPAGEDWSLTPYQMFLEQKQGPFEPVQNYTFKLVPFENITGKILDPDGKPVKGATLNLTTLRSPSHVVGNDWAHKEMEVVTDAAGVFQAMITPNFTEGFLECNAPGFMPCRIELKDRKPDRAEDWTFTVQKGTDVSGRVVDTDGKGVADVWVNFIHQTHDLLGRSVKTDADGRFVAASLGTEEYLVSVLPQPQCPNADNVERVQTSIGHGPPMFDKYVFGHSTVDLRNENTVPGTLTITGLPTVALKFVWLDETPEKSAIHYSSLSFHGQSPTPHLAGTPVSSDTPINWSVQAGGEYDPQTRAKKSGTVYLPKGVPFSLSGSLIDSVVRDGAIDISQTKRDWTLEYRFGKGEWRSCTKAEGVPAFSYYVDMRAPLEALTGNEETLEIRMSLRGAGKE